MHIMQLSNEKFIVFIGFVIYPFKNIKFLEKCIWKMKMSILLVLLESEWNFYAKYAMSFVIQIKIFIAEY